MTRPTIYCCIIVIFSFFSCEFIQQKQDHNQQQIKLKYCTVIYQFEKKEKETDILKISIKSNGDYKINGEKYPPIKLTLFENNNLKINPLHLTAIGLEPNTTIAWDVLITNKTQTKKEVINAGLDTIICVRDKCIMENNRLNFELYF